MLKTKEELEAVRAKLESCITTYMSVQKDITDAGYKIYLNPDHTVALYRETQREVIGEIKETAHK